MDEITRELRQYCEDAPGDEPTDAELDALIAEAIGDAIWRAACEDVGLDLYARTDPDEPPF